MLAGAYAERDRLSHDGSPVPYVQAYSTENAFVLLDAQGYLTTIFSGGDAEGKGSGASYMAGDSGKVYARKHTAVYSNLYAFVALTAADAYGSYEEGMEGCISMWGDLDHADATTGGTTRGPSTRRGPCRGWCAGWVE